MGGEAMGTCMGVLVMLTCTMPLRTLGQPVTGALLPPPAVDPTIPSPYVIGMPRSGHRVQSLSLSKTRAPGLPGGPPIAMAPDEGGPRDPIPAETDAADGGGGADADEDAESRLEARLPRERIPAYGTRVKQEYSDGSPHSPRGNGTAAAAPGPSAGPSWNQNNPPPNSLGAIPGVYPTVPGQKVLYEGEADGPGLLSRQWAGLESASQPSVKYRPPDIALCIGDDIVLTAVNLVIQTYNATTGEPIEGPIDFTEFLNVHVEYSDVACIFDAQDTRRFYLTVFGYELGDLSFLSLFAVAVSKTSNPIDGFYGPFIFRNDGLNPVNVSLPAMGECEAWNASYAPGCLGDYPVVGIDQHGLWASFNLFQLTPGPQQVFAGPLVMGISKRDMMYGQYTNPAVTYITNFNLATSFTVAPSWTMPGTPHDTRHNGTLYLFSTGSNTELSPPIPAIALWAITQTARLDDADFPHSGLPVISQAVLLDTLGYVDPASLIQPFNISQPAPGLPLDPGDARTTQLSLSGPYLWSNAQTVAYVGSNQTEPVVAAIYWGIFPFFDGNGTFNATTFSTGYVGVEGKHVGRPAVVGMPDGQTAWMTGFISSKALSMSPFYVAIQAYDGPGPVRVPTVAPHVLYPINKPDRPDNPMDPYGPGVMRAGDYSTATMDEHGNVWLATEWSGGAQSEFCAESLGKDKCPNWGTYIMCVPKADRAISRKNWPIS
eukprot:jgi/Botrbrau1/4755/Bobra.0137s0027.1